MIDLLQRQDQSAHVQDHDQQAHQQHEWLVRQPLGRKRGQRGGDGAADQQSQDDRAILDEFTASPYHTKVMDCARVTKNSVAFTDPTVKRGMLPCATSVEVTMGPRRRRLLHP